MKQVPLFVFDRHGHLVGPLSIPRVEKSDAEWQDVLTPEQFAVARAHGTERPFCGTLLDNKRSGAGRSASGHPETRDPGGNHTARTESRPAACRSCDPKWS